MDNKLTFGQSWTVPNFKKEQGVDTISISKNSDTGARYFDCGAVRGPVAKAFDSSKEVLITYCHNTDTGEAFHMLHNRSLGNVVETL